MTNGIPKYHLYGKGGSDTSYGAAKTLIRDKEETITYGRVPTNRQGLIRSREGNGKLESITIDNQEVVNIKLRHNEY